MTDTLNQPSAAPIPQPEIELIWAMASVICDMGDLDQLHIDQLKRLLDTLQASGAPIAAFRDRVNHAWNLARDPYPFELDEIASEPDGIVSWADYPDEWEANGGPDRAAAA